MSRRDIIHDKLVAGFTPSVLDVIDESGNHSVRPGSESHFKVVIVSDAFEGQTLISRHRAVNASLADELHAGLHALSIHAYTPQQWRDRGGEVPASPPCLGGSKHPKT
jgi:stress-induced morphogen